MLLRSLQVCHPIVQASSHRIRITLCLQTQVQTCAVTYPSTVLIDFWYKTYSGTALVEKNWKLVGDNLDLTVKVRDMRLDNPNQQYHFFHTIAVQDRISTAHLDDSRPQQLVSNLSTSDFVPSSSDYERLRSDLTVLVSRIVVAELSAFQFMSKAVPDHILHDYSREMARPSVVVGYYNYSTKVTTFSIFKVLCFHLKLPLGVILKNENINGEMIEIMETLHQYVPTKNVGSSIEIAEHYLFGGDQLTCARARSAKRHRQDSATAIERLEGLLPVIEDWHTKMCLFEVCMLMVLPCFDLISKFAKTASTLI